MDFNSVLAYFHFKTMIKNGFLTFCLLFDIGFSVFIKLPKKITSREILKYPLENQITRSREILKYPWEKLKYTTFLVLALARWVDSCIFKLLESLFWIEDLFPFFCSSLQDLFGLLLTFLDALLSTLFLSLFLRLLLLLLVVLASGFLKILEKI